MNRIQRLAVCAVSAALMAVPVFAQDHDDHHDDRNNQNQGYRSGDNRNQSQYSDRRDDRNGYVEHKEWRRGYRMNHDDWNRAQRVDDWRDRHLRQPPRGYEWRQVDGNYVLGNINTGVLSMSMAIR